MNRSDKLGQKNILNLLLEFSIPSIAGMLINALYNVVDRIYVGQGVGTAGISALTIVFPIQLIIFGFGMLVGIGGSALISISLGQKNREKAEHIVGNGFTLLLITGLIISALGIVFLDRILIFAGATNENFDYAYKYFKIIFYFTPFQFIGYGLNSFIRSEGNPVRSMLSMFAGAITNIILDPILIFGFNMGVQGAAIATGISLVVTAVWNIYYFTIGRSFLKIKLKHLILDIKLALMILKNGLSPFFTQVLASFLNIILNNQIKVYGGELTTISQASIGIIQGFNMMFFMPIIGINMGAQPIIGFNYGAKNFERVKKTLIYSLLGALIFTLTCFLTAQLIPEYIFKAFNSKDRALIEYGSGVMKIVLFSFPVLGSFVVCTNYFQSIGKPVYAALLGLTRPIFLMTPLIIILPKYFGLNGIWFATPVADIFSAFIIGLFMIFEIKKLNKKHMENNKV